MQADVTTSTLTLQVMQNLVYSSTSPIQTFMRTPFLRFSRAHCLWLIITVSHSTTTICVHARCLKIRNSFRRWFMKQVLTRQIWNLLKPLNISAVNARITLKNGRVMPIRSGLKKPTKHHSTQITKNNYSLEGTAEAVPFLLSAIHLFQTSHINLHVNILKSMISITRICKLYLQFFLFVLYFLILLQLSMQPGGKF